MNSIQGLNGRNSAGNMVKNNIASRIAQAAYVPLYVCGASYAAGRGISPADANVSVQYKMQ
jgi:hypothetical protein